MGMYAEQNPDGSLKFSTILCSKTQSQEKSKPAHIRSPVGGPPHPARIPQISWSSPITWICWNYWTHAGIKSSGCREGGAG